MWLYWCKLCTGAGVLDGRQFVSVLGNYMTCSLRFWGHNWVFSVSRVLFKFVCVAQTVYVRRFKIVVLWHSRGFLLLFGGGCLFEIEDSVIRVGRLVQILREESRARDCGASEESEDEQQEKIYEGRK